MSFPSCGLVSSRKTRGNEGSHMRSRVGLHPTPRGFTVLGTTVLRGLPVLYKGPSLTSRTDTPRRPGSLVGTCTVTALLSFTTPTSSPSPVRPTGTQTSWVRVSGDSSPRLLTVVERDRLEPPRVLPTSRHVVLSLSRRSQLTLNPWPRP